MKTYQKFRVIFPRRFFYSVQCFLKLLKLSKKLKKLTGSDRQGISYVHVYTYMYTYTYVHVPGG